MSRNADDKDKEFSGLGTLDEKCVKLCDRSAEDYSIKTGKFSKEVDLHQEKSPTTRNTNRLLFKRIMERNGARCRAYAAAAFWHHGIQRSYPAFHIMLGSCARHSVACFRDFCTAAAQCFKRRIQVRFPV